MSGLFHDTSAKDLNDNQICLKNVQFYGDLHMKSYFWLTNEAGANGDFII